MTFLPRTSLLRLTFVWLVVLGAVVWSQENLPQGKDRVGSGGWGEPEFVPWATGETSGGVPKFFLGQKALSDSVELNATNCFFDRCFAAVDPTPIPVEEAQAPLIRQSFKSLVRTQGEPDEGTVRWHLHLQQSGPIQVELSIATPSDSPPQRWKIHWGEQTRIVNVRSGKTGRRKNIQVQFDNLPTGVSTLEIQCVKQAPVHETRIERIRLRGRGIQGAYLLRARWRPSAVHQGFVPARDATEIRPELWVFETRSLNDFSSYSPMTTPFGYFGTSLNGKGVAEGAGFNFSMWIAGRNEPKAPPVSCTPHLIATGLPDATYSYFGHEGTGVKFRDAVAYPQAASRVIQAMRAEFDSDQNVDVFYGYFYDEIQARWVLYASGQKPASSRRAEQVQQSGTLPFTGSFCEIPGPPARERSGDRERVIQRRGWFYGQDHRWYAARMAPPKGRTANTDEQLRQAMADEGRLRDLDLLTNKWVGYAADYSETGWINMATGGIQFGSTRLISTADQQRSEWPAWTAETLPEYLSPEKARQLWEVPVEFGKSSVDEVTDTSAKVTVELNKTGPRSRAVLWYGPHDSTVFTPQEIKGGSAALRDLFQPGRTWADSTPESKADIGLNCFEIENLKPATTYYYRLFIQHDEGKSWDTKSGSFTTKPAE
jgi:hypothetical protein